MSAGTGSTSARAVGTTRLPSSSSNAAHARKFVVDVLQGWQVGGDARDDAELVVSELVTNSFLHGGAAEVDITLADHGDVVRLEVSHREVDGAGGAFGPLTAGADDTHGRGLAIVDVLSSTWGVVETDGLRRVWAELPSLRTGLVPTSDRAVVLRALVDALAALGGDAGARPVGDVVTTWSEERLATRLAGVALADPDRAHLRYLSLAPLPAPSAAQWARFSVATPTPATAAYLAGGPLFHESRTAVVAAFPDLGPALEAVELAALANLPLCHGSAPFGVLTLGWTHGRELDAADRRWLGQVADVVAAALLRHGADGPTGPG